MSKPIKFVHVPLSKSWEFRDNYMSKDNEDIVRCEVYLNMKENKIYFVEKPKHGGAFEDLRGLRSTIGVYDDYAGEGAILADSYGDIESEGYGKII